MTPVLAPPTLLDLRTQAQSLGGGRHGEVFLFEGRVYKAYNERGWLALEREHMIRAGLEDWVLDTLDLEGREVLVMRAFDGVPVTAQTLPSVLEPLHTLLERTHKANPGVQPVEVSRIARRLERFRDLTQPELEPLFEEVETALLEGTFHAPTAFCHLDLWADNVLVSTSGQALVIDWVRAGWDDPMRDIALFKSGTLDLLEPENSLDALRPYIHSPTEQKRLRSYLALTYLHDIYWLTHNEPGSLEVQYPLKLERGLAALEGL